MLLGTQETLEELLVRILAERPAARPADLHAEVCRRFREYSLPAVYKELRKLQNQGVVFRTGNTLSLSLAWVLNLTALTDRMYDVHVESRVPSNILPDAGHRKTFRFSNLARADDFWIHAVVLMLQNSKQKEMFQWFPHPWFNLVGSHKSLPFHQALREGGFRVENIVGGDTLLDRRAGQVATKGVYEFSFAPGPFQDQRRIYYSVTDTYLLTIKLTDKKAFEIDRFYDSTTSMDNIGVSTVLELITNAPGTVVTIEKGGSTLTKVRKKFLEYFRIAS